MRCYRDLQILKHATEYNKGLFGHGEGNHINMRDDAWGGGGTLSDTQR